MNSFVYCGNNGCVGDWAAECHRFTVAGAAEVRRARSGQTKPRTLLCCSSFGPSTAFSAQTFFPAFFFLLPAGRFSPSHACPCAVRSTHTPRCLAWVDLCRWRRRPPPKTTFSSSHVALSMSIVLLVAEQSATQYLRIYTRPPPPNLPPSSPSSLTSRQVYLRLNGAHVEA